MFTLIEDNEGYDPYNSADTRHGTNRIAADRLKREADANRALAEFTADVPAFLRKQAD